MELMKVFKNRRSVRKFKDIAVSEEIIEKILEGASLAPETDTCNYYFGVIRDNDIKKKLGEATHWADWISKAPVIFACCGDISWDIGEQSEDDYGVVGNKLRYDEEIIEFLRNNENRKASKTLLMSSPVYIAAQHMILTAVDNNLRGCLVDFMNLEKINSILNLPENITCQVLVPIGYPDEQPKNKESYDKSIRVFKDKWRR
jgi:nitroreductase